MGDSRIVIPVIVGVLILGTLGFTQEVYADHEILDKKIFFLERHQESRWECDGTSGDISTPEWEISYGIKLISDRDHESPGHEPCVYYLRDFFSNEGTLVNYGTLIIDPWVVTVLNKKTIENYGTIVLRPIPPTITGITILLSPISMMIYAQVPFK